MEIITIKTWDEVTVKLNNHETLLLLQSLREDTRHVRDHLPELSEVLKDHPDMTDLVKASLKVANGKVKLHNELLKACRSDYEHLILEPIVIKARSL